MLPAPTTTAISTPRSETSWTCVAIRSTRSGSVPYSSEPIRASPESFSRTRLKTGSAIGGNPTPGRRVYSSPTAKRAKRAIRTFSPVFAASSARSCSIVLPS